MVKNKELWMKHIDRVLLWLITIFIGVMLISQSLLLKEGTRLYLSKVDKMEGEDLVFSMSLYADMPLLITEETTAVKNYQNLLRRSKMIIVKMMNNSNDSNVAIIINGKKIDDFRNGSCKFTVYDGDYVEIDGTTLKNVTSFLIQVPSDGLLSPQNGLIIDGKKGLFPVGKIKFKNK